jgi:hypothetical protein
MVVVASNRTAIFNTAMAGDDRTITGVPVLLSHAGG